MGEDSTRAGGRRSALGSSTDRPSPLLARPAAWQARTAPNRTQGATVPSRTGAAGPPGRPGRARRRPSRPRPAPRRPPGRRRGPGRCAGDRPAQRLGRRSTRAFAPGLHLVAGAIGSLAGVPARWSPGRGCGSRPPYASQVVDLRQAPGRVARRGPSREAHGDPTKTQTKALQAIAALQGSCQAVQGHTLTVPGH